MGISLKLSESEIKKSICDWLAIQPDTFFCRPSTTGIPDGKGGFRKNHSRGISDIIGVKKGKAFFWEVKTSIGKPTEDQIKFLMKADKAGGYACIVRSLKDAQEAFAEI